MAIPLVIRGIGKGSLFSHGRIFGIHNPFDSAQGKAKDPFINLRTLSRIERNSMSIARAKYANNPSAHISMVAGEAFRLERDVAFTLKEKLDMGVSSKYLAKILRSFDEKTVFEAISKSTSEVDFQEVIIWCFSRGILHNKSNPDFRNMLIRVAAYKKDTNSAKLAYSMLHEYLTTAEIDLIAEQDPSVEIKKLMIEESAISRKRLLSFANQRLCPELEFNDEINIKAYARLALDHSISNDGLKNLPHELDIMSGSPSKRVQEMVFQHPLTRPDTLAGLLTVLTPKSRQVILHAEEGYWATSELIDVNPSVVGPGGYTSAPEPEWIVTRPAETGYIYDEIDVIGAVNMLMGRSIDASMKENEVNKTIAILKERNPELAAFMQKMIKASRDETT